MTLEWARGTGGDGAIDVLLGLLVVLLLTIGTGFYVAGEFALVAVDRSRIERLAEEGHRGAISTLKGLRGLSFQLSGAQLGITVTSLVVGFIAEPAVARALRPLLSAVGLPEGVLFFVSVTLALIIATTIQMVLGELVPKNLAIARPLEVAFKVVPPLRLFNALLKPLIQLLNASANRTVRLLGIEPREELVGVRSLEELGRVIDRASIEGALADEAHALLARSVTFGTKTAADALVPRLSVVSISSAATLADLAGEALKSGHSRLLVVGKDLDDVKGVAHVRDSYRYLPEQRTSVAVTEMMQDPFLTPESRPLDDLLADMRRNRVQLAVVFDEYGGTAGIITLEDLLEEIVGEIEDEYDLSEAARTVSPEGVHVLPGLLRRDELEEACGFKMPEGEFETLAGFLLALFDRIPRQGDHVGYRGWEFKVTKMDRNRIDQVLAVEPPPRDEEER